MSKKDGKRLDRFKAVPPETAFGPVMGKRIEASNAHLKKEVRQMSDVAKLDSVLAEVKSRFEAEQGREKGLAEKRAEIDRAIAQSREEQVRLQGEYRAIEKLKLEAEPPATDKAN